VRDGVVNPTAKDISQAPGVSHLRSTVGIPEDPVRMWVGHADASITDRYSQIILQVQARREWAEKAELGFTVPKDLVKKGEK